MKIDLLEDTDFKYGYIIAKCKLVDCKIMTKELINKIKQNNAEHIIQREKNEITLKNQKINIVEFCNNWSTYSLNYSLMINLYIAYSFSNSIIYFMKECKTSKELDELKNYMLEEMQSVSEKFDSDQLRNFIDKFVQRNKYIDFKYVN